MIEPAGLDPLVQGYAPGAPMGWRAGQSVSIERFLGVAAALARRLPQARETTAANTVAAVARPELLHPGVRRYLAELGLGVRS